MDIEDPSDIAKIKTTCLLLLSRTDTDEWMLPEADTMDDLDSDIYAWSADYCASLIYSGGFSDDDNANNNKRREFWLWYLNTAVVDAYNSI